MRRRIFLVLIASISIATPAIASPLRFTVLDGPVSGPPYPTSAIRMNVEAVFADFTVPIGTLSLILEAVSDDIGLVLTPGAEVGGVEPQPFIEVAGINPQPFAEVAIINPCFDVDPFGGSNPILGVPRVQPVPDDGRSFEVHFDIVVEGGVALQKVHFTIGTGQPLVFANPFARRGDGAEVSFQLLRDPTAPFAPGPLFTMTYSGEFTAVPEPASITLVGLGLVGLARSRARRRVQKRGMASD